MDPTIYRIHEITQVYGTTIKALIHEEFGRGIMSAITFRMDSERVEHPEGDRVRIIYEGKFCPTSGSGHDPRRASARKSRGRVERGPLCIRTERVRSPIYRPGGSASSKPEPSCSPGAGPEGVP